MKRSFDKITIILLFTSIISCEKAEEIVFQGPYHARFTESESEIIENFNDPFDLNQNEPGKIQLHVAAPTPNNTTVIEYEVSGTAVENIDYLLEEGDKKRGINSSRAAYRRD